MSSGNFCRKYSNTEVVPSGNAKLQNVLQPQVCRFLPLANSLVCHFTRLLPISSARDNRLPIKLFPYSRRHFYR